MFGDSFFTPFLNRRVLWIDAGEFSSPCLGILFSPARYDNDHVIQKISFRPHVWGFFFHTRMTCKCLAQVMKSFVPMFGDSFFTQQAWGGPRDGLSMALLRRGFPIDWNSHYFHPLTYCFLRFHAYRRGFLYL